LFLRSFETRQAWLGAPAGVAAALAILSMYYAVSLIAGLVLAAVAHPGRWKYLNSAAP
jgi:hypothetical protein